MNIVKQLTNTVSKITTNPLDPNTWKVSKFVGMNKGALAVVASTVILEFATQGIERFIGSKSPFVKNIFDKQFYTINRMAEKLPTSIDKTLDVRDLIVLAPTITSAIKIITDKSTGGKKNRVIDTLAGLSTKGVLRMTGLNPNPQVAKMLLAKQGSQLKTIEGLYP